MPGSLVPSKLRSYEFPSANNVRNWAHISLLGIRGFTNMGVWSLAALRAVRAGMQYSLCGPARSLRVHLLCIDMLGTNIRICRDDVRSATPYFASSGCGPRTVSAEVAFGPGPPVGALQGRGLAQVR
jgi:hypothetical protein